MVNINPGGGGCIKGKKIVFLHAIYLDSDIVKPRTNW